MGTQLGKVRGLGSSKSGTGNFMKERLRSAALLLLTPYILGLGTVLLGRPYEEVTEVLARPWVAIPLVLYLAVSLLHMRLGMQSVIEDYTRSAGLKLALTAGNYIFCLGLSGVIAFALVKIMIVGAIAPELGR